MSIRRVGLRACLAVTTSVATVGAAEKRPIAETDLFRFVWVADPQIAPDGKRVAFVRVSVNKKKEGYDTAIWVVPADAGEPAHAFTSGTDTNPRWSPDGRWLAFNRAIEKDGKLQPAQLWLLPTQGGEARALTDLPKGAGPAVWSPDGKTIAFTSTTSDKDLAKKDAKTEPGKEEERESDVRVITRAVYRLNGTGYLDPSRPSHLWTVGLPDDGTMPKPRRVTSGPFSEDNPSWSPDGQRLYFTSNRTKEPYYSGPDTDVFSVPVGGRRDREGGRHRRAHRRLRALSGRPAPRRHRHPERQARALVRPARPLRGGRRAAPPVNLTAGYDYDVDGGATGDQRAPRGAQPSSPVWARGRHHRQDVREGPGQPAAGRPRISEGRARHRRATRR